MDAHLERLLSAVGEPFHPVSDSPLLSEFDWRAHDVSHPYIVFMTGRCGSTWLTSLMRKTNLVGNPDEFFNVNVVRCQKVEKRGLRGYLETLAERHMINGRFGLQIDSVRLRSIAPVIDWGAVFPSSGISSFFLYRNNILAQAWSWAAAIKTGLWHQHGTPESGDASASQAAPGNAELVAQMVRIRGDEQFLEEFFSTHGYEPYYIAYESLLCELDLEMKTILRLLGLDYEEVDKYSIQRQHMLGRIEYSEKDRALSEFSARHSRSLSMLRRRRFEITPEEVAELFRQG